MKNASFAARAFVIIISVVNYLLPAHVAVAQNDRRGLAVDSSKTSATTNNQRLALIIGNSAYLTSPLKNPANDARAMSEALRELGFEVMYNENATQVDMKRSIREFGAKLKSGGIGLFYYAGHGIQVKGVNYLVPVDAKIESEEEVEYEGVDAGFVLAQMDSAKNSLNIVILDACRNNPFARSFRSASSGLAQMDAPSGTLIAYATAPGSIASDGTGSNGLYTQELLKNMRVPGVSIEEVFKQVRVSVRSQTQGRQTPWESSSLTGDFYFNKAKGLVDKSNPASVEIAYWENVKNSNDAAVYQAYLERYPNGMFADVAKNRYQQLILPSVDTLISNYIGSIGGKDAIGQVKTMVRKGSYEVTANGQKLAGQVELYEKKPGKSLLIMKIKNSVSKEVYDGLTGWIYDNSTGTKPATARQIEIQQRSAAWTEGDIDKIRQTYPGMVIKGKEKLGEQDVFVVEVTPPEGKAEKLYFDTQTGLLKRWDIVLDSVSLQQGIIVPTQLYLEDYVDVSGFKLPMTIRQVNSGVVATIKFNLWDMKFNVPLDDNLFKKPTK